MTRSSAILLLLFSFALMGCKPSGGSSPAEYDTDAAAKKTMGALFGDLNDDRFKLSCIISELTADGFEETSSKELIEPNVEQVTEEFKEIDWSDTSQFPSISIWRYPVVNEKHISLQISAEENEGSGKHEIIASWNEMPEGQPWNRLQCDITDDSGLGLRLLESFARQDDEYRTMADWK